MSSPSKTWTVVCFVADETVEAVPTRWITGDECLWPAVTREKLNVLIKKCEFNSSWPSHKVRTFRNATYDDYGVARLKASKAELTSDLNTDEGDDSLISEKRIRKKKIFSSSESEDEPIMKTNKKKRKTINLPQPPIWTNTPPIWTNADLDTEENNFNDNHEDVTHSQATTSFTSNPLIQVQPASSPRTPLQLIKDNMNKPSKSCCCNQKLLYNIQSLLIEINSKVGNCNHTNIEVKPNHLNILEKSQIEFPISTMEKLKDFENFLSVPENYKSLVQFFSKLGGNTTYELIRRCIAPIVEDSLAEQFSFLGKKGKNSFGTTLTSKAVIEAAQISGNASNNKETEQRIGDWLRRAKERNLRVKMKKSIIGNK